MVKNKYLTIKDSVTVMDDLGNFYPDIMSFPINKFVYNDVPVSVIITQGDIARFDIFCSTFYGVPDYTDLILWLNSISSVHDLTAGDELKLPTTNDIQNFYSTFII